MDRDAGSRGAVVSCMVGVPESRDAFWPKPRVPATRLTAGADQAALVAGGRRGACNSEGQYSE